MIQIDQYYGSSFEKWAKNFCYKNSWRVQHLIGYDVEDCYSQCALWWVQCYQFYEKTVHDDALMMYMYQLWVRGQFNDLSNKETKYKKVIVDPVPEYDMKDNSVIHEDRGAYPDKKRRAVVVNMEPITYSEAELSLKLEKASDELKEILKIFVEAPKEIMDVLRQDCQSSCPKSFFKKVITYLKIDQSKSTSLAKELQQLLS